MSPMMDKVNKNESLESLYKALESHDWAYEYAEGQAWHKGDRESDIIRFMRRLSDEHEKLAGDYTKWCCSSDGDKPMLENYTE